MIEVQVAVRDTGQVRHRDAVLGQAVLDRPRPRRERRVDLGIAEPHTVVEQEDAARVHDRVGVGRPPLPAKRGLLVGREPELRHQERDHLHVDHRYELIP
jgi:hypothetical protein